MLFSVPVGPLIKLITRWKRSNELPEKIEQTREQLNRPVVEQFSGVERFEVAEQLLDAKLTRELDGGSFSQAEYRQACQNYLESLEREYEMAKNDLEDQSATKAEVAALGIAVKQMALTYDEQVEEFEEKQHNALAEFADRADREVDELEQRGEKLKKTFRRSLSNIRRGLNDFKEELKAEQNSELESLEEEAERRLQERNERVEELEERLDEQAESLRRAQKKLQVAIFVAAFGVLAGGAGSILAMF